jgi:hypothetical protein
VHPRARAHTCLLLLGLCCCFSLLTQEGGHQHADLQSGTKHGQVDARAHVISPPTTGWKQRPTHGLATLQLGLWWLLLVSTLPLCRCRRAAVGRVLRRHRTDGLASCVRECSWGPAWQACNWPYACSWQNCGAGCRQAARQARWPHAQRTPWRVW